MAKCIQWVQISQEGKEVDSGQLARVSVVRLKPSWLRMAHPNFLQRIQLRCLSPWTLLKPSCFCEVLLWKHPGFCSMQHLDWIGMPECSDCAKVWPNWRLRFTALLPFRVVWAEVMALPNVSTPPTFFKIKHRLNNRHEEHRQDGDEAHWSDLSWLLLKKNQHDHHVEAPSWQHQSAKTRSQATLQLAWVIAQWNSKETVMTNFANTAIIRTWTQGKRSCGYWIASPDWTRSRVLLPQNACIKKTTRWSDYQISLICLAVMTEFTIETRFGSPLSITSE